MRNKKPKIAVAMSGGVDSSVSAMMLKDERHDISGFYMNLGCGSSKNAKKVAKKLKTPFFEVDGRNIFRKKYLNKLVYTSLKSNLEFLKGNKSYNSPE